MSLGAKNAWIVIKSQDGSRSFSKLNIDLPYAREKTDLLNRPTSQKCIIEIDTLSCQIHTFMLFLDALAQEKYI